MILKLENLFSMGDRVAVALSGGKDSVALFHALLREADKLNIEVLAINVEHGIRARVRARTRDEYRDRRERTSLFLFSRCGKRGALR